MSIALFMLTALHNISRLGNPIGGIGGDCNRLSRERFIGSARLKYGVRRNAT
jgi:hypothetical protein